MPNRVPNDSHDKFFRESMSRPAVAKEFFKHYLPREIIEQINLDTLKLQKGSFIDKDLRERVTDLLYAVEFTHGFGYIYLLVEHQSRPDELMPLRLLEYSIKAIRDHLKRYKTKRLPVIYPLVFYHGRSKYTASTDIFDLFDDPNNLMKEVLFKPFKLIDLNCIPDEQLKQQAQASLMSFVMKHAFARDFLPHLHGVLQLLQDLEKYDEKDYAYVVLKYIFNIGVAGNIKDFETIVYEELSQERGDEVMNMATQFMMLGEEKGIQKGIQKGMQKEKRAIALKLINDGLGLQKISGITGLSDKELEQLGATVAAE